jgi:hypothetical protein
MTDGQDLVAAWLKYHELLERSGDLAGHTTVGDEFIWAIHRLDDMVREAPEECWRLVMELVVRAQSDYQLASLAAGPLEDLLAQHGGEFIERVEVAAAKNDRFRETLIGVWRNEIPEDVWVRVEKARGTLQ